MSRIAYFMIASFLAWSAFHSGSALAQESRLGLADVTQRVKTENYNVYSNALRVYQAKESISVARGNLLPHLNLWRVVGGVADGFGGSMLGLVEDLAPFLVPANWFRLEESQLLYLADTEGYRALWANELMTARAIYAHILLDTELRDHLKRGAAEMERLRVIVQSREMFGGAPPGASRDIEIRKLGLQDDIRALETLLAEEKGQLYFMLAMPADSNARLEPIVMPDFDRLQPLDFEDFRYRATSVAPEIREFSYFISAADWVQKEVVYSALGASSASRGTGGGVFDNLPQQIGLGFGTPASLRIVSAQKEILKIQQKAVEETILRQLDLLVKSYNLDLENYVAAKRRLGLTTEALESLDQRIRLGQSVETLELLEASRNQIQSQTALLSLQFRLVADQDRLARLTFNDEYDKQPVVLEKIIERQGIRK